MGWKKNIVPAALKEIHLEDDFFLPRLEKCRSATIPSSIKRCEETGRFDAFKLDWKEGMPNKPHFAWDSDVAKVLEGMAYILALYPDKTMEEKYDSLVDLILSAQGEDGYINPYFTVVDPEGRWGNLHNNHELYCAGHLIEAAVAGYEVLGKRKFLDAMIRYADHIDSVFGPEEGKKHATCGHPEIELALMRLAQAAGEEKYARLAAYFVNIRGVEPNYFRKVENCSFLSQIQADKPVREFEEAFGHAVRAVYLLSGMADTAEFLQDESLFAACERVFENLVNKRMYVTGGIGSSYLRENFTSDYDLPNGSNMYAESCAAIGLVLFSARMFRLTGEGRYMDIVERCLYNGILSGISLEGDRYFYSNYLEMTDHYVPHNAGARVRQAWFSCSCCPTNFCRFIPRIQSYIWGREKDRYFLALPVASTMDDGKAAFRVESNYPYSGNVKITILRKGSFELFLRVPDWCKKTAFVCKGEKVVPPMEKGFARFAGEWEEGDRLEMELEMKVRFLYSHPAVVENRGRIALARGPLVYCCESRDNPTALESLVIDPGSPMELVKAPGLPEGTLAIRGRAFAEKRHAPEALYSEDAPFYEETSFLAIPYALWQNRGEGNMMVWLRKKDAF